MGSSILGHGAGSSGSSSGGNSRAAQSFYQKYDFAGTYSSANMTSGMQALYTPLTTISFDTIYLRIYFIFHINATITTTNTNDSIAFLIYGGNSRVGARTSPYLIPYQFPSINGATNFDIFAACVCFPDGNISRSSETGTKIYEYRNTVSYGAQQSNISTLCLSDTYECILQFEAYSRYFTSAVFNKLEVEVIGEIPIELS